jgi:cell division protein ZapA
VVYCRRINPGIRAGPEGAVSERASASTTEVEIFGATYVIRGGQQPEYLSELAAEVDRRMRELAGHVTSPEPGRLAILTALNLADELSRSRTNWDGVRGEIEARVTSLAGQLAKALDEGRGGRRRARAATKIESRGNP